MAEWSEPTVNDEDRLPWLETVDDDDETGSTMRVFLLVLLGLAVIAAALLGYYWYHNRQGPGGEGALIAAQEGDYKVKPDDPGGMNVEGEGDTAIATSNGKAPANAAIDLNAQPETPVSGRHGGPAPAATAAGAKAVVAVPASGGALTAQAPAGAMVQLGSFPDAGAANAAWSAASQRFGYVASLGKSVVSADVGGRTMYRLRVNAGSAGAASALCARLKTAGQACFVPTS